MEGVNEFLYHFFIAATFVTSKFITKKRLVIELTVQSCFLRNNSLLLA